MDAAHGMSLQQLLESRSRSRLRSFAAFAAETTIVFPALHSGVTLLVTMPSELICQVAKDLDATDLFNLIMTAKPFATLLLPLLYTKALFHTYLYPRNGPVGIRNCEKRFTVLEWAVFNDRPDLVRKFLALTPSSSDPEPLDNNEEAIFKHLKVDDAIEAACKKGHVEVLEVLLETRRIDKWTKNTSISFLHRAVMYENVEILRALVRYGLMLAHKEYMSSILLRQAIMMGNIAVVDVLVSEAGAVTDELSPELQMQLKGMLNMYDFRSQMGLEEPF